MSILFFRTVAEVHVLRIWSRCSYRTGGNAWPLGHQWRERLRCGETQCFRASIFLV